ncbi:hypothetical protein DFR58_12441 [Anaerobacterium chartisolvens]|uniref:Uncharacterized protein n=1 Tax=Anaerobacterium chartisolvens TaxID=1297424 RepID=A0A369AS71_9FIRM|nr:hypothetical protein [Anaerobacterium chartisolvens]RCX12091.1 hypothetical protein DFR58_12441 [Anaerobacterium chartisolvens]
MGSKGLGATHGCFKWSSVIELCGKRIGINNMALKKTPPRERRLQMAKAWIPTYTGKNIVKGYRKHFALSPLGAVADLQMMGYEFTPEYIEELKRDEVNRSNSKRKPKEELLEFLEYGEFDDEEAVELWWFSSDDECGSVPPKTRKFKNHEFVDGKLLQTNKKFSQLKEKQKALIAEWFFIECNSFYKNNNKFPSSKSDTEAILDLVYDRIQERDIWIPFGEIKHYFGKRKTKIEKRVLKKLENV